MHLKPTAGCQRSILIFEKNIEEEGWARTLPSLIYFYGIFIEPPLHNLFSNIKVGI
jgi:hypothetical protein